MSEQYLVDVLREAPRPRRAWYFWPAVVISGIFAGAGAGSVLHDEAYLGGGFLIFAGVWTFGVVLWAEGGRR